MTVSTDLEAMLHDELGHLREDRDRIAAKIKAIHLLLETAPETPMGTFSADDARNHAERPVEASGEVVERPKRKARKGSRPSLRAKLSDKDIENIRALAAEGYGYSGIAEFYPVGRSTVSNVINRKGCYA